MPCVPFAKKFVTSVFSVNIIGQSGKTLQAGSIQVVDLDGDLQSASPHFCQKIVGFLMALYCSSEDVYAPNWSLRIINPLFASCSRALSKIPAFIESHSLFNLVMYKSFLGKSCPNSVLFKCTLMTLLLIMSKSSAVGHPS